jgi:CRP-like cAMP-binding protein
VRASSEKSIKNTRIPLSAGALLTPASHLYTTGDYFYVIKSGCVVFQVNGTDVGKAKEGASFGELSLLYTVRAARSGPVVRRE